MTEETHDLTTADGQLRCYVCHPDGTGRWPAVILYMDAFGVRAELEGMAQRLAAHGYVVALPDLYYRSGVFAPFDPAQVAAGGSERDRFKRMIASLTNTLVMRDTAAVLASLETHPAVRDANRAMGVVGYCMGGGFALCAAGTFPERIAAAAAFHGGSLATDAPDSAHRLADRMRGRLYIGVAGIDPSFPREQQERLENALAAAKVQYTLETYERAKHGFAVTGHLAYDREASERHWERLLAFFGETLRR